MFLPVFLIPFAVYVFTSCPVFAVGDSAELASAAYKLGIAHPSGYPLYCISGKIFSLLLPFANIAFRLNLMSSFFAFLSLIALFLTIKSLLPSQNKFSLKIIAFSLSLIFAFSEIFWSQAVIAEVYTMNSLFVILTFYFLIRSAENIGYFYLFFAILGLSFANHHSMILLVPVYALYFIFKTNLLKFDIKKYMNAVLIFLLPLFLYLYLPLRAEIIENINWGDPSNLKNIMIHILRSQFPTFSHAERTLSSLFFQISGYFSILSSQFSVFILLLAVIGIIALYRTNKKLLSVIISAFIITSMTVIVVLNPAPSERDSYIAGVFFIPSFLFAIILIGFGINSINRKIKFPSVFIILPFVPFMLNFTKCDLSGNYTAYNYGINILNTLETGAVLFSEADNSDFSLLYLTEVENKRKDVMIYSKEGNLFKRIYGTDFANLDAKQKEFRKKAINREIILKNSEKTYYVYYSSKDTDGLKYLNKRVIPAGCLYKAENSGYSPPESSFYKRLYNFGNILEIKRNYLENDLLIRYQKTNAIIFPKEEYDSWSKSVGNLKQFIKDNPKNSEAFINLGIKYTEASDIRQALEAFNSALKSNPGEFLAYKCIGNLYFLAGDNKTAIEYWQNYLILKPNDRELKNSLDELKTRKVYDFDRKIFAYL